MSGDKKLYHFDEVKKHSATKDCWLIIHGKVYDVSLFMDEHPGGDEVLLASSVRDATNDFEDVGHSDSARELMHKYCIGEIDDSTIPAKRVRASPAWEAPPRHVDKPSDFTVRLLQLIVPVVILALAFLVRYYTKAE